MMIMKENCGQYHTLPAINETFPLQFNHPIMLLSPLDLSLRASDVIPITPPSTPSPPRKRPRFLMDDGHHLWRPHAMGATESPASAVALMAEPQLSNYLGDGLTYSNVDPLVTGETTNRVHKKNNYLLKGNNLESIPDNQGQQQPQQQARRNHYRHQNRRQSILNDLPTFYVDDDDDDDDDDNEAILLSENEEESETLECLRDGPINLDVADEGNGKKESTKVDSVTTTYIVDNERIITNDNATHKRTLEEEEKERQNEKKEEELTGKESLEKEVDEEDEYVDILSNDDDEVSPLSSTALYLLNRSKLTSASSDENAFCGENSGNGQVLTRNQLVYDNKELHSRAVDGFAKLFDRDFRRSVNEVDPLEKTYTDLTSGRRVTGEDEEGNASSSSFLPLNGRQWSGRWCGQSSLPPQSATQSSDRCLPSTKTYKISERRRMKLRKNVSAVDEDTISPVSGTIIRKLRDDEQLVVRKGDIDPAFNVVEITEEAKAILASIDNKIGDYLCQLCRTLYDDAFQLAQHRCPRIVHIEYKCSECEKVFNCPANLASHRRWHKPKLQQISLNESTKQKSQTIPTSSDGPSSFCSSNSAPQNRSASGEINSDEGIFPCQQCGKTFRRHSYLKKHLPCHQIIDNLKTFNFFKNCGASLGDFHNLRAPYPQSTTTYHSTNSSNRNLMPTTTTTTATAGSTDVPSQVTANLQSRFYHNSAQNDNSIHHQHHHQHNVTKVYPQKYFNSFSFPPAPLQQQPFYTLEDLYLAQHLEHNSAFQYVQATNATTTFAASNNPSSFLPRPFPGAVSLTSVPIK